MSGMIWQIRPGVALDFKGLPWSVARLIIHTLNNPRCSPDSTLLLADALAELRRETEDHNGAIQGVERDLRVIAPIFGVSFNAEPATHGA